ncbi:MAG: exodeoxyribonuclease VII large subunit [Anaerolineae bacterium]|nr:exodeoxyribonuclease VII large subunit [Candidatus Roseilinea sp.]MDW8450721.1 exodeoxyribonuclease VII large subunit [Anaerolineae bacterium]
MSDERSMQYGFQSILQPDEPLSVSELTAHIKDLIEGDEALGDVRVAGEISNLSRPTSGHLYFTLKDVTSQIRCVMWRSNAVRVARSLQNGDAVIARGRIGVYERDGVYQLYVEALVAQGAGDLTAELERLKRKLEAEGLFDAARKRPLPAFPRVLGVVTSPTGAAFQDILNVLRRRYPIIEVVLAPTAVQGEEAPEQIVRAIHTLNALGECDVILVARGGGSLEELWAFNDERVVRAIAASRVPVVSGVGHEIDFTLADFAADVRAPTPSAAAEIITPDINDLRIRVDELSAEMVELISAQIADARAQLAALQRTLRLLSPANQLARQREKLNDLSQRLSAAQMHCVALARLRFEGLRARLESVGPAATLARGYAIVRRAGGELVRSVGDVRAGDALRVTVADGEFGARVTDERDAQAEGRRTST